MNFKQIRLFILVKHIDGGTGTFVEQIIKSNNFEKNQIVIKVAVLEKPRFRNFGYSRVQTEYFSEKQLLPYYYTLSPLSLAHIVRELWWLKEEVSMFKPSIILSVDNHCNVLVCLSKFLFQAHRSAKVILTIHNNISAVTFSKLPLWGRWMFQRICHFLFKQANKIVCVSQGVALDVKNFFALAELPMVIYYGVNAREIVSLSRLSVNPEDTKIMHTAKRKILSIGRFAPQKDFRTLIQAFKVFADMQSNTDLYIIGDGPDRAKISEYIRTYQIGKRVHLLGWKQNIYPYIKEADIFVLSSYYEGFPFVLLEAGVLGKPIIATDCPYGPRELLGHNEYGLMVPPEDPLALALELYSFMDSGKRAHYKDQIIKRVNHFSEKMMIKRYLSLIESVA